MEKATDSSVIKTMDPLNIKNVQDSDLINEVVQSETIKTSSPLIDVELDIEGVLMFIDEASPLQENQNEDLKVITKNEIENESSDKLMKEESEENGNIITKNKSNLETVSNRNASARSSKCKTKTIIKPEQSETKMNIKSDKVTIQPAAKKACQTGVRTAIQPGTKPVIQPDTRPSVQSGKKSITQLGTRKSVETETTRKPQPETKTIFQPAKRTVNKPVVKKTSQPGMRPTIQSGTRTTTHPGIRTTTLSGTKQTTQQGITLNTQTNNKKTAQPATRTTSKLVTKATFQTGIKTNIKQESKNIIQPKIATRLVSARKKSETEKMCSIKPSATRKPIGDTKLGQNRTRSRSKPSRPDSAPKITVDQSRTAMKSNASLTENGQILKNISNTKTEKPTQRIKMRRANSLVADELPKMSFSTDIVPTPTFTKQMSISDQAVVFKDLLNPRVDFDQLSKLISDSLDEKEKECLKDLKEYLIKKEDAWVLDQKLLNFIGGLLDHRSLNPDVRARMLRLLAAGALRQDFWSFLQMDRKNRHLMKYANDFADLQVEEQKAICLFLCNNFSSSKGSEWLLYGSTWPLEDGKDTCNVRITSRVAGYSLVSYTPSLQDYGSALIYNIASKEAKALSVPVNKYTEEGLPTVNLEYGYVTDKDIMGQGTNGNETQFVTLKIYNDIAMELSMAILKYIKKTKNPAEEILYRCVKSLVKFSFIIRGDLLSSIAMVQVDLDTAVPGISGRIDSAMAQLRQQLLKAN